MRQAARRLVPVVAVATLVGSSVGEATHAQAGTPELRWVRRSGTELDDAAVSGTDTYVTGVHGVKGVDGLLVQRFGGAGTLLWTRTWRPRASAGQVETTVAGHAISVGVDGAVYVGGLATLGCREDQGTWFLRKYGPRGRLLWHRQGPAQERCEWRPGTAIDDLAVRGTTVAAAMNECGGDFCDGRVEVFSTRGMHLRSIPFEPKGVDGTDRVQGVDIGPGGVIYAAGWTATRPVFDPPPDYRIAIVAARAATGAILWSRALRDAEWRDFDGASAVAVREGLVAVAGMEQRPGCRRGLGCPIVIALRRTGHILWRWRGGAQVTWDGGSVDIAPGPRILAGWTLGDSFSGQHLLLRLRPDGTRVWIARASEGSLLGLAATRDRISVVGHDSRGGALWRYAY